MDLGRVITAMVTPMNEDLSINYEASQKLAEYLLDNGSDSLVICGTTGESPTTTPDEKIKLFEAIKEVTKGRALMIAGTSSYDTAASVALTKKAAAAGADVALAVTPYYNKPPQEGLYRHFQAIAQASELPVILYNVPSRTGVNLEAATTIRLSQIENIIAVKEASGNLEQASQIKAGVAPDFQIYSGDDSLTLPLLSLGASGVISVASHLVGNSIQEMVAAFDEGDTGKALELHLACYQVFRKLFICSNPMPLKYCLNRIGINVGPCRLPLTEVSSEHAVILDNMLHDIGLL